MQLSFVFITALFAAVSATPLPQAAQTPASLYYESVPVGGSAGNRFSDLAKLEGLSTIPTITGFGGRAAVAIHQVYLKGNIDAASGPYSSIYGGDDGAAGTELILGPGEFINYMEIETDFWVTERDGDRIVSSVELVHFVKVGTNLDNWGTLGTHKDGRLTTPYYPPPGYTRVVGLNGKSYSVVDQLGPVWA